MGRNLFALSLAWAALCLGLPCAAPAADEPPPPPPLWRQAAREVTDDHNFLRLFVADGDTLWNEFSRSQLYRSLAQDPAVAASATKLVAEMDKRKKTIGKAIGQEDDMWLVSQLGKLGPFAVGFDWTSGGGLPKTKAVIRHRCDPAFVTLLLNALGNARDLHLERLQTDDFTLPQKPFAHREKGGEIILSAPGGGPNLYSNGTRFLVTAATAREDDLIRRAATAGVPNADEDAFAAFLGKTRRWLAAVEFRLPVLVNALVAMEEVSDNDFKALLHQVSPVYLKEAVNKSNRFDLEVQYEGADLNKGLLFLGLGRPLNSEVAQIFPDELLLIAHVNYDFQRLFQIGDNDLQGTSASFRRAVRQSQQQLQTILQPVAAAGQPALPGPKLTTGASLLVLEPDRLEDLPTSLVVALGVEPGFKLTADWVKALPVAQQWDKTVKPVKLVSYSDTDIAVIGEGRWVDVLTVVNGVLLYGSNLKQVKRVVKYLNKVKAGEADPRKANEWQHITALAEQDGFGGLNGFALMKMDWLLKVAAPTGLGAGTLLIPDLPTDVNWGQVAGRLQPATCVLLHDPQKGLKGRMVSDLPLGTLITSLVLVETAATSGGYEYYWGPQDPDDLPPVGAKMGALNEIEPEEDAGGDPVPAPVVNEAEPAPTPTPNPAP